MDLSLCEELHKLRNGIPSSFNMLLTNTPVLDTLSELWALKHLYGTGVSDTLIRFYQKEAAREFKEGRNTYSLADMYYHSRKIDISHKLKWDKELDDDDKDFIQRDYMDDVAMCREDLPRSFFTINMLKDSI